MRYLFAFALLLFVLVYHVWGYVGHFGYDDMYYAQFAYEWSKGNMVFGDDHFAYRWGIIAPMALVYWLFGISDTTSAVVPMLATVASGAVLAYVLRRQQGIVLCLAWAVFVLNWWTLFYTDKIMPDGLVALSVLAAAALLYRYRYELPFVERTLAADMRYAFAFVLCLFVGFLSKETIWLSVPMWAAVFISDMVQRQNRRFWVCSMALGALLLGAYFGLIAYETGSPFYRFYAIERNSYFMPQCSYDRLPRAALLERISYGFPNNLLLHGMAIGIFAMLPALWRISAANLARLNTAKAFVGAMAIIALASGWLMTISFKHYSPMCPDPRHYLFIIPLAAWAAAPVLHEFTGSQKHRAYFGLGSWVLFGLSVILHYETAYSLYLPLAVWASGVLITYAALKQKAVRTHAIAQYILAGAFVFALCIHPVAKIINPSQSGYKVQKEFILQYFKPKPQAITVICNEVEQRFAQYYYGFETGNHTYITYKDVKNGISIDPQTEVYVLMEGLTQWLCGHGWDNYPKYAREPPPSFEKVYDNAKNIAVYRVGKLSDLGEKYR